MTFSDDKKTVAELRTMPNAVSQTASLARGHDGTVCTDRERN
jgi:hypothetical protein